MSRDRDKFARLNLKIKLAQGVSLDDVGAEYFAD